MKKMDKVWCERCSQPIHKLFYHINNSDYEIADLLYCRVCLIFYVPNVVWPDEYRHYFIDEYMEDIELGYTVELDLSSFYLDHKDTELTNINDPETLYQVFYFDEEGTIHYDRNMTFHRFYKQLIIGEPRNLTLENATGGSNYIDPYYDE